MFRGDDMKHKGKHQYRFASNPKERIFAKQWDKEAVNGRALEYLLAEIPNEPNGEVTARDILVAATVIQWLGSPIGQSWLQSTQLQADAAKE